jgi:hypothetical protein
MKKLILIFLLALFSQSVFSQIPIPPNYVPTNGLVGWWPFNGNANDESGNGNNGTVNGATLTNDRFGVVDKAYSFDGINDFIQCLQSGLTGNQSITVSFWMKTGNGSGQIFTYGGNGTTGNDFRIIINSYPSCLNSVAFDIYNSGIGYTTTFNNTWDNYVVSYNSSSGSTVNSSSIYKNGILLSSSCFNSSGVTPNFMGNYPITFGRYHGTIPTDFFQGQLDDIGYWNRALSDCEIQNLYSSTNPTNTTTVSVCDSYTWNGTTYNSSGVYSGTTTNCVTESLDLTITPSSTNTTTVSACDSYTWNGQLYSQSGVYSGPTTNCVSESLNLTINSSTSSTQSATALDSYTWSLNNQTYIQSGTYTATIPNAAGCDSVVTLNLTLNFTGISENSEAQISISPNPASSKINVKSDVALIGSKFIIYDALGKEVKSGKITSIDTEVDLSNLNNGVYLFKIGEKQIGTFKIIKE